MKRVLVIGLDGACFDVIDRLADGGAVPTLERLMRDGVRGPLESTVPPTTIPAWFSMATGLPPGELGVSDFLYFDPRQGRMRGVGSSILCGRAVWDVLGRVGLRVGLLNFPLLWPPCPVNGFATTGVGATADDEYAWPRELKQEIERVAGGRYHPVVPYHKPRYDDLDLFFDDLETAFEGHDRVATHFARKDDWSLLWVVFSATDWLQHRTWSAIAGGSDGAESDTLRRHDAFWTRVDRAIAGLIEAAGDGTTVLVVSDHGFGSNDLVFRLNAWLEQWGYLTRRGEGRGSTVAERSARAVRAVARAVGVHRLAPALYDRGRRAARPAWTSASHRIDLEESTAFDPGHTVPFGGIYVRGAADEPERAERIARELSEWGRENGVEIDSRVRRGQPVSNGRRMPDIIVSVEGWSGVILKEELDGPLIERRPLSTRHTGSHRPEGILVAHGPGVANGVRTRARITQIAPTILRSLGLDVPQEMTDGVMSECLPDDDRP
ncbi:MAG: hypothetical protein GF405_05675 [Candidatus Eisenbacteria bacterium]|nr:hypothetical protein [Candidatus Eisenbacteria bacterium]